MVWLVLYMHVGTGQPFVATTVREATPGACFLDSQVIAVKMMNEHPTWEIDHFVCSARREEAA